MEMTNFCTISDFQNLSSLARTRNDVIWLAHGSYIVHDFQIHSRSNNEKCVPHKKQNKNYTE